jgi:hypothetical protein
MIQGFYIWLLTIGVSLTISLGFILALKLMRRPKKTVKSLLEKTNVSFLSLSEEVKVRNKLRVQKMRETISLQALMCHMFLCFVLVQSGTHMPKLIR